MADHGQADVQQKFDKINSQGFTGVKVDPEPNETYTLAGVTGTTQDTEEDVPNQSDTKDVWVAYAITQGYDEDEGLTKAQLIAEYGS